MLAKLNLPTHILAALRQGYMVNYNLSYGKWLGSPITLSMCSWDVLMFENKLLTSYVLISVPAMIATIKRNSELPKSFLMLQNHDIIHLSCSQAIYNYTWCFAGKKHMKQNQRLFSGQSSVGSTHKTIPWLEGGVLVTYFLLLNAWTADQSKWKGW